MSRHANVATPCAGQDVTTLPRRRPRMSRHSTDAIACVFQDVTARQYRHTVRWPGCHDTSAWQIQDVTALNRRYSMHVPGCHGTPMSPHRALARMSRALQRRRTRMSRQATVATARQCHYTVRWPGCHDTSASQTQDVTALNRRHSMRVPGCHYATRLRPGRLWRVDAPGDKGAPRPLVWHSATPISHCAGLRHDSIQVYYTRCWCLELDDCLRLCVYSLVPQSTNL